MKFEHILIPEYRKALRRATAFAPTNLHAIAERLNIELVQISGTEDVRSVLEMFESGHSKIFINENVSSTMQRFLVAKEMAHVMLAQKKYVSEDTIADLTMEILMPERLVQEYCEINECDPRYHGLIAKHFGVTVEALQFRLKQLGLEPVEAA